MLIVMAVALSGTVFIDRSNRESAIAAFDGAVKEIKGNKQSVWIFPVCVPRSRRSFCCGFD
jgi:1-acyl-sn-glycerol-3-phosphate acyltransferase